MGAQWKQKHREASANAKGKIMTKLAKEIAIAARSGTDPAMNSRLRLAMEAARKVSMSKETLERAIKKGSGQLGDDSAQYEAVTYEGYTPHKVPLIVQCLTDNKNRTATSIRVLFDKGRGQLGTSGSVSWDFARLGAVEATPPQNPNIDFDEEAIEAGAQEVEGADEDGTVTFYTEAHDLDTVSKHLTARDWAVSSAKLIWKPKNAVTLEDDKRKEVETFLQAVQDDDDVEAIFVALA